MDPAAAPAPPVQLVMDYRTQKIADLPLFNGDESDAMKPDDFIRKTEAAKDAMRWDDATTTVHFKACLRGIALTWLKALEFKSVNVNDWNTLKQEFINEFVTPFQESNVLANLTNLVRKPKENPRDYDARICQVFIDIKKNRPAFVRDIPANPAERTVESILAGYQAAMDHDMHYIIKCFFISGIGDDLQKDLLARKPVTLRDANKVAQELFEQQKSSSQPSKSTKVAAVEDNMSNDEFCQQNRDDPEVAEALMAIQRRRNGFVKNQHQNRGSYISGPRSNNYQGNSYQSNNQQTRNTSNGNNGSRRFCLYCKKDTHNQEYCYTRKNKGHCLVNKDGKFMDTPGTREFDIWKKELQAKGKRVMIIDDTQSEPSSNKTHLN
jgi:hypothetical protein